MGWSIEPDVSKEADPPGPTGPESITEMLHRLGKGDPTIYSELLPLVYEGLREIARRHMRHERSDHTLQPTALVHEAYLRLVDQDRAVWEDRTHFLCIGAKAMRRVLVDHARARTRQKRGGGIELLSLEDSPAPIRVELPDLVALDEALTRLAKFDQRKSDIVELHYFGGLSYDEIAEAVSVSPATVARELNFAKSWLYKELANPTAES